ncbi:MAG: hypothetical protein GY788_15265, partial [bacterium]|nr:hypothetical protein [bacterium]
MIRARHVALVAALVVVVTGGMTSLSHAASDTPEPLTVPLGVQCEYFAQISSDSRYLICVADTDSVDGGELYSVPIDGSAPPIRLNPVRPGPEDVVSWVDITPDGSTVLFAHGESIGSDEFNNLAIYSVPIGGGEVTSLTPDIEVGGFMWKPEMSPDGSAVVYWWWDTLKGGLYAAATDGSGATLIGTPSRPQLLFEPDPMISPDSNWVHYHTNTGTSQLEAAEALPITGGSPFVLTGDGTGLLETGWFTPDSQYYVFLGTYESGVYELFATPIAGGDRVKLNQELAAGQRLGNAIHILPDSSGVVFSIIDDSSGIPIWYRVPISGGTPTVLSDAIYEIQVTADSSYVVLDRAEINAHSLDDGTVTRLGDMGTFLVSPDSSTVWLWQNHGQSHEDLEALLYTVPINGGELTLHPGTTATTDTDRFGYLVDPFHEITPDSSRYLYVEDVDNDSTRELVMASVYGGQAHTIATGIEIIT